MVTARKVSYRGLRWFVLGLAFAAGAASVLIASAGEGERSKPEGLMELARATPAPGDPLLAGGELVSLEEADAQMEIAIVRPNGAQASDGSITEVWIHREANEVAIRYASGLLLYLATWRSADPEADARAYYVDKAGADPDVTFQFVGGHPAMVIPAGTDAEGGVPPTNAVDVVVGSIEVRLKGDLPLVDLVQLAESLH
jgi:hypothetical protein